MLAIAEPICAGISGAYASGAELRDEGTGSTSAGSTLFLRPTENTTGRRGEAKMPTKADMDNHADQLNPNNDAYWQSRDYDERPNDWEERVEADTEEKAEG